MASTGGSLILLLRTLALGLAGAALFVRLGTPLPWLLGPLFLVAGVSVAGGRVACPAAARNAGQWVIGTALGLYFTPEALSRLASHGWSIGLGVAWAYLIGFAMTWALMRHARIDPPTAFFAGAVGGASDMAVNAEHHGGDVASVAAAHSLRVIMVVTIIPFAYQWLGLHGRDVSAQAASSVVYPGLAWLSAVTLGGAWLLRRWGAANGWVIGPLLVAATLTATGHAPSQLPAWLIATGQLLIGISLGTRFTPDFFARAPRLLKVMAIGTVISMLLSVGFGLMLARITGFAPETMVLATSPGGIAEMALTAKILQLGVPVVTVFQVTRMVTMVLTVGVIYRWLAKRNGWTGSARATTSSVSPP